MENLASIQRVAVISRIERTKHFDLAETVITLLEEQYQLDVYLNDAFAKEMNYSKSILMTEIGKFNLIVSLGGDGTLLWTSRYSDEVPIFGINAGHLGFLTSATLQGCKASFERIMKGDFILEHYMRIKVFLDGKELPSALNDAYVTNKYAAKICTLNLTIDGYDLGCHRVDGFLVSTPVGSTAYALSAGGSIIEPKIKAMQVVPVNSVMRKIRPFVVPGDSKIIVTLPTDIDQDIIVVNDGLMEGTLKEDSKVEVTKDNKETVFLRFSDYGFFNRLQDKLGF